jgi:hypothetical protein
MKRIEKRKEDTSSEKGRMKQTIRISGSHGGEYEDCCLLGCSTV